jgi:hypothetical protein
MTPSGNASLRPRVATDRPWAGARRGSASLVLTRPRCSAVSLYLMVCAQAKCNGTYRFHYVLRVPSCCSTIQVIFACCQHNTGRRCYNCQRVHKVPGILPRQRTPSLLQKQDLRPSEARAPGGSRRSPGRASAHALKRKLGITQTPKREDAQHERHARAAQAEETPQYHGSRRILVLVRTRLRRL